MATYRYSKYDKDNSEKKKSKFFNALTLYFRRLKNWLKANLFALTTVGIAIGFLVLLAQFWTTGEPSPTAAGSTSDPTRSIEKLLNNAPALIDAVVITLGYGVLAFVCLGLFAFYLNLDNANKRAKTVCPSCKEPWCDEVYDKSFLGTDKHYNYFTKETVRTHRAFEKIKCSNCGHLWTRET